MNEGDGQVGPGPLVTAGEGAGPFGVVLGLVLVVVIAPFLLSDSTTVRVLLALLQAGAVVVVLRAVSASRRQRRIAAGVVVGGVLVAVVVAAVTAFADVGQVLFGDAVSIVSLVLALYVPVLLLRDIGHQAAITVRTLAAALTVYLLLGLAFALTHLLIDAIAVDAYSAPLTQPDALYLSFVTLTTLGYGDLVPVADPARGAALLEAVLGQLYLVSAVALVVGNLGRTRPPRPGRR